MLYLSYVLGEIGKGGEVTEGDVERKVRRGDDSILHGGDMTNNLLLVASLLARCCPGSVRGQLG